MQDSRPNLVTASIVLYKSNPSFIESIVRDYFADDRPAFDRHLYLIDNSPTDKLVALLKSFPALTEKITYKHLSRNVGFGTAHNVAFRLALDAGSRYHLLLNPDVRFSPSILTDLYTYMEANPDVGLSMPRVTYPDGSPQHVCKLLPRPIDVLVRRFVPLPCLRELFDKRYELRYVAECDRAVDVPSLSGCFMFIRCSLLNEVKGFDERFFMYVEDVDLCRRIGERARTVCLPYLAISHEFSRGSYHDSKLLKHHLLSMIRYFNKWGWLCDPKRKAVNARALRSRPDAEQ